MFAFGPQKRAFHSFPGAPDRISRSGPTSHPGGRSAPARTGPSGPSLPRRGVATGDDDHRGRVTRPWRDHVGVGAAGRSLAGGELVCRGRPTRPRGGSGSRVRHRPASGGLRAASGEWMGRGGGRPAARRRRRPGTPTRSSPPDGGPPFERQGPRAPDGAGGVGRPRQRVARRRRPGAVGRGDRVGRGRPWARAPAGTSGRVRVSGRRSAGRAMECSLWLPAGSGVVAATRVRRPGRGRTGRGRFR